MSYSISHTLEHIQNLIFEQIHCAFNQKPNIAGTLHGQRRIYQGCLERRTSLFPSRKAGGSIALESKLELAYTIQLESLAVVESYRTQALNIPIGQNQNIFPDFLIRKQNGEFEVHEVKPSIQHLSEQNTERFDRLATIFASIHIPFKLVDECTLPRKSLDRLLHLYSCGHRHDWKPLEIELAHDLLIRHQLDNLQQAHSLLEENQLPSQLAEYLLFHHMIDVENIHYENFKMGEAL